ncbi:MAG: type pilus assembly protein PilN, partial [Gaiellaceae bacterium]|nr:type pilus assembly protein PilN [Gaiellaceae bacterium]
MKPLHLNLASRPFRDYKPVYAVVVLTSLLIAFLMLNNVDTYYRYVSETQTTRARIAQLEAEAVSERRRESAADAQLHNVDLVALDSETKFINARLAERAFSWSELLDRLERVIPEDVRIRNIAPTFQKTGLVHLELNCEARKADGMLLTLNQLEASPHFSNPIPHNEDTVAEGAFTFAIGGDNK